MVEASDGKEALCNIDPMSPPDLILMDQQMPNLSGIECARSIKALYPFLEIVLVSGSLVAMTTGAWQQISIYFLTLF